MIDAYIDEEITDQTIKSRRNKRSQFHHFMKFAGDRRVNKFEDQDVMAYRKHLQATQIQKKPSTKNRCSDGVIQNSTRLESAHRIL